jgi:hypothetical protein
MPLAPEMTAKVTAYVAVLILVGTIASEAQRSFDAVVISPAPVRLYPDENREPLATLPAGTYVRVLSRNGDWCQVSFRDRRWGERIGYVRSSQVKSLSAATAAPAAPVPPSTTDTAPSGAESSMVPPIVSLAAPEVINPFAVPLEGEPKVMIFGGNKHDTYLGCLSCNRMAQDSIFNKSGEYGTCRPSANNLFCRGTFNDFGGATPLHHLSACSEHASDPPVIVDDRGNYFGRFSVGGMHAHRDAVCGSGSDRFKSDDACRVVRWVCSQ